MKSFARGMTGVGLLILRLAVALNLLSLAGRASTGNPNQLFPFLAVILGFALLVGFLTSTFSCLAAASILSSVLLVGETTTITVVTVALLCLALAFAGPGGYSLDALLWGPRTVTFPKR